MKMSLLRQAISNSYHGKKRQEAHRQQEIRRRERREALERDVPFEIQLEFLDLAEFGLDKDIPKVKKLLKEYPKLAIIDDLSVDKELTDILISDDDEADRLLIKYNYRLLERKGSYNALMYFIRNENISNKHKNDMIQLLIPLPITLKNIRANVLMNYTIPEGYRVSHNAILLAKEAKLNRFAMTPLWEKLRRENKEIFDILLREFVEGGELVQLRGRYWPVRRPKPIQIPPPIQIPNKKSKPIQIPKKTQLTF